MNEFEVYQVLSDERLKANDCTRNGWKIELPYDIQCEFHYEIGNEFHKEKAKIAAEMTAKKLHASGLF